MRRLCPWALIEDLAQSAGVEEVGRFYLELMDACLKSKSNVQARGEILTVLLMQLAVVQKRKLIYHQELVPVLLAERRLLLLDSQEIM